MLCSSVALLMFGTFDWIVAAEATGDFLVDVPDFFDGLLIEALLGGDLLDDLVNAASSLGKAVVGFRKRDGAFGGAIEDGGVVLVGGTLSCGKVGGIVDVGGSLLA